MHSCIRSTIGAAALALCAAAQTATIPLGGSWRFQLDPQNAGHSAAWPSSRIEAETIFLPGSTDQAGFGSKTRGPEKGWLSRPYTYEGAAWYQRDVVIPETWKGKHITLFLERPHWQTEVWVDGTPFGLQNSLSTPHEFELSAALAPGHHTITVCVDNTYRIDVGRNAHSVTEHTQTNWNGITGRIELRATDPVWIDSVEVWPDLAQKQIRVVSTVRNATAGAIQGSLTLHAPSAGIRAVTLKFGGAAAEQKVETTLPIGASVKLWDELQPAMHVVEVRLQASAGANRWAHFVQTPMALRTIGTRGTQFTLNGRPIFLRGTLECDIFPRTGYPPTTAEEWARIFTIAKSYGLNHFRFHSWCPPEAAFVAADEAGFLLHVELPVWSNKVGRDPVLDEYMRAEGRRILKTYGNHPSFTMLCLGNELTGEYAFMDQLVAEFKAADSRRLYTFTADHRRRAHGPTSDYYVTHNTKEGPVRIHGARFTDRMTGTDTDFTANMKDVPMPLVAHELGQWVVFPDYAEVSKYTGVLKARNLEAFRDKLDSLGMLDQVTDFQKASGKFAWLAYKEDIETALRTPGFGGFQLLQLHDFPGQGEALIGLLDSFWDSKGILAPEEFRRFCSETVPLLRFAKFVWRSDETFAGRAELAHYGRKALTGTVARWSATDDSGTKWGGGPFAPFNAEPGTVASLGKLELPLDRIRKPTRVHFEIAVDGTAAVNGWDIWVYPAKTAPVNTAGVRITQKFDNAARMQLENGGKVVLLWPAAAENASLLPMRFLPVFWSLTWFPKQPGTMGILCDPGHPALAGFPTAAHSDWQWWELTEGSRTFVLDETPPGFRPIVQVIDDYHRNHKLGAIFEARVGRGKLLVSSLDLDSHPETRVAARQLRQSLLGYAASEQFNPTHSLSWETVTKLLATQTAGNR